MAAVVIRFKEGKVYPHFFSWHLWRMEYEFEDEEFQISYDPCVIKIKIRSGADDDVKKFFNNCKKIAALDNGADDVDISMEEEIEE